MTSASGNLGRGLPALGTAPWARLAFSNSNKFTGSARATGWSSKIGAAYKLDNGLTLGLSYHFKSALRDMRTSPTGASITASGGFADNGRVSVMDFQWPAMAAIGAAWQISPTWLAGVDLKHIQWSTRTRVRTHDRPRRSSKGISIICPGSPDCRPRRSRSSDAPASVDIARQPQRRHDD